ncbi:MAG: iron-sulfur cluster assembly-related protein [Amphiamblys sp. WSBS2006]|nr:MAG: iron-sulfur cluster assembly-related protein [Amphiamblys sp. WSBS2006]
MSLLSSPSVLKNTKDAVLEGLGGVYHQNVLEHYRNPQNVGSFLPETKGVGTGLVGAPECGDVMKLQIKVNEKTQEIEDAKFKTFGCGSAIASSSLATVLLKGKTLEEAGEIKNSVIASRLHLPPVKLHCSVLAEEAIQKAIDSYRRGREKDRRG